MGQGQATVLQLTAQVTFSLPPAHFSRALCEGQKLPGVDQEACFQRCLRKNHFKEKDIKKEEEEKI